MSKNKIIENSKALFKQYGYQKTTLTDIAKSLGKVKSAIYYYFSGKEEIFAELVRSEAETFLSNLVTEVEKYSDPEEQLVKYVDVRVDLMEEVAKRYSFLKKEFFELMPIVDENRQACDQEEIQFLTGIFERINEKGNYTISTPEFKAKLLMKNIKGLEIQMYVTDQVQAHNEDREAFIEFILFGIYKNK